MSNEPVASEGFVVLGCGLPRTGTASLRAALKKLLKGKVYHGYGLYEEMSNANLVVLEKATKIQATSEDWRQFFDGQNFRGALDWQVALFWKQILKAYPNCKFIYTKRDPESWYKSASSTIEPIMKAYDDPVCTWFGRWIANTARKDQILYDNSYMIPDGYTKGIYDSIQTLEGARDFHAWWEKDVTSTIPKEQLLIFEAKEGWEPLCKFLGVPVPDEPYPHVNDRAALQSLIKQGVYAAYATVFGLPVLVGIAAYYWRDCINNALQNLK